MTSPYESAAPATAATLPVTGARRAVPAAPLCAHLARHSTSDATALLYTDETCSVRMSYAELWSRSDALARALAARARPGAGAVNRDGDCVVAVCMQRTHKTVLTLLACWKAGAAYLPVEADTPPRRISHVLQDAAPALVIYHDCHYSSMFAGSGFPSVSFKELSQEAGELPAGRSDPAELLADSRADSIAAVLYTTGTTGLPKGVRIPYSAICNRLWWQFRTFPFADKEAVCVWKTALTFVDSLCEIWGPLVQGRSLLILSRGTNNDPHKLVQVLAKNQVQRLVLVPTLLRSILVYLSLNNSERPLQTLKLWISSGETLSKDLAAQFFHYFGDDNGYKLANFYGSTEVTGDVTYHVLENTAQLDLYDTVPIGTPLDNCEVNLLDNEMEPVGESEVGEIWVAGDNLTCGYVGEHTSDKFCENPQSASIEFSRLYRTGDFGMLQRGVILYAGRTDSQVKVRGHRVDLQEVERAVLAADGVQTAVVLCFGLATCNLEILAFVTLESASAAKTSSFDIQTILQSTLVSYMLPQVVIIQSIPLLVNGKVDRLTLLKMYENRNKCVPEMDYSGVGLERLEMARVLFETVREVLGPAARGALCLRAGFYELGGNSLNTILTITRLREKGCYIEISDFLEAANLGEVLSKLSTNLACSGDGRPHKFTTGPMKNEHKPDVMAMVNSFLKKAELDRFLRCRINIQEYNEDSMNAFWPALLAARLSIVLTDASGTIVAVAFNSDAYDGELAINLPCCGCCAIAQLNTFIHTIEDSVRETMIPQGKGKVLQNFLMATAEHLSAQDNVAAICTLEHATVQLARDRGFTGVFATNTSPLTQQVAIDVMGYEALLDCQVNRYVDCHGDRVFGDAPDHVRVLVCWKPVNKANALTLHGTDRNFK